MPSAPSSLGFHHATFFAGDPYENYRFYTQTLGMRLVKHTVNFDEPGAHHFYYSSDHGNPGSILTAFPGYHRRPLARQNLIVCLAGGGDLGNLMDPDGQEIEYLPGAGPLRIHSVKLKVRNPEATREFFHSVMGFESDGHDLIAPGGDARVQVVEDPEATRTRFAAGIVHHVAFSVMSDDEQVVWREALMNAKVRVSQVKDRHYFHSIYFREPGGVLLEIATRGPGFGIDEDAAHLGETLKLPPWFELIREEIESRLIPFDRSIADHVPA